MMMLAVMYGMIPSAKIEKLPNAPPREQVEEAERTLLLDALLELLDRVRSRCPGTRMATPRRYSATMREQ